MNISKAESKKFAKLIVDTFLDGKEMADLQGTTQDHIDAFVIPIMTEVEDVINNLIATKIQESLAEDPLNTEDEWWSNRR